MKIRNILALLAAISLIPLHTAWATPKAKQDIEALRQHVHQHISTHYKDSFGEKYFKENVKIHVGRIDSRLRLAKCDDNLTYKIHEPPHNIHNITIKTSCMGEQRWAVYIPATIDVYANVLVSKHSLARGDVLTEQDLSYKRVNIANLGRGHIEDIERAIGMELKRPLKSGNVLHLSYLTMPDIVQKGQLVVVSSKSRFLNVEVSGVALVNGHMGERIRVKNERSNRVVSAEVVAPGKVAVVNY